MPAKSFTVKRIIVIVAVVATLLVAIGFVVQRGVVMHRSSGAGTAGKISVVASFYPMYFLATQIGGDRAVVRNITPAGAEPHDYGPTSQDMAVIEKSQLVILNGGGLEAWKENAVQNSDPKKTVIVVAGEGLTTQQVQEGTAQSTDPHIWLAPLLAKKMVDNITTGFTAVDAGNASYYESNADILKQKLDDLDALYRLGLANCAKRDIITSHSAFGYLASAYGLNQVSISGLSPDAEPSSRSLSDVARFAQEHGVRYIFFESLVSPKLAETIANEVGAQTLVLNPIEGLTSEEMAQGKNYFTEMQANLTNLKIALECGT